MKPITIGNDECIHYIRKHYDNCSTTNAVLGRKIWEWLQSYVPGAQKIEEHSPCYWGDSGEFISEIKLPKTAAQFEFNRQMLPGLYEYLDQLGQEVDTIDNAVRASQQS